MSKIPKRRGSNLPLPSIDERKLTAPIKYEPLATPVEPKQDQEFKFGFTGFKSMPEAECDPFLLKPQQPGTVGAAIQMLQKLDPTLPMYFDCPECGKAWIVKTVRFSAVVETEERK